MPGSPPKSGILAAACPSSTNATTHRARLDRRAARRREARRRTRRRCSSAAAIAVGGGLLVLLLLFFGIRGCQASQKEQGFKDYVRDADELVAESEQQSTALFELLEDPGGSEVDFTSNVNGIKVQAEQLVERANDTRRARTS